MTMFRGLKLKPSYEELIKKIIEADKLKIKYPNRNATLNTNFFYMNQVDGTFNDISSQHFMKKHYQEIEQAIEEIALESKINQSEIRKINQHNFWWY